MKIAFANKISGIKVSMSDDASTESQNILSLLAVETSERIHAGENISLSGAALSSFKDEIEKVIISLLAKDYNSKLRNIPITFKGETTKKRMGLREFFSYKIYRAIYDLAEESIAHGIGFDILVVSKVQIPLP